MSPRRRHTESEPRSLEDRLETPVRTLAEHVGERNIYHPEALAQAEVTTGIGKATAELAAGR